MLVTSCMKIFESVAFPAPEEPEAVPVPLSLLQLESLFLLALTWSIGATVDNDGRHRMDEFMRLVSQGRLRERFGEDHIYT